MTTLGIMKERIADELRRDDLSTSTEFKTLTTTSNIHDAIMTAINEYQGEELYFKQSRGSVQFDTVAAQYIYTSADDADISRIVKIEYGLIEISGFVVKLVTRPASYIESSNSGDGALSGQPAFYNWYGEAILLEPIPEAAYTCRFGCILETTAPASDIEASNRWMTDGELLIRCRAKAELYAHVIKNAEMAAGMHGLAASALDTLRKRTEQKLAPEAVLVEAWDPYS